MRRSRVWTELDDDAGSASLEFITAGMILLVPIVYLVLTMAAVQGGALAVEGAARQAARVYVQADDDADAAASVERAVGFALVDHGIDPSIARVDVVCAPNPGRCLTRRGTVTVAVRIVVPLPLSPPVLDLAVPVGVPLEASATQRVSRFWGSG